MSRIRAAEEAARLRLAEAEAELPMVVGRADSEGRSTFRDSRERAEAEADGIRRAAEARAAEIRETSRIRTTETVSLIDVSVSSRFEQAVAFLLERFAARYNGGGN